MKKYPIKKILTVLFFATLFLSGGLGKFNLLQLTAASLFFLVLFMSSVKKKNGKNIKPYGSTIFFIFLYSFILSLFWSLDKAVSIGYFWIFASGYIFWFYAYNRVYKERKNIFMTMLIVGISFSVLFIVDLLRNNEILGPLGLYRNTSMYGNHNHIGDYWAILTILSVHNLLFLKDKKLWFVFSLIGSLFVAISMSRVACVSLAAGLFYLIGFLKNKDFRKIILIFFLVFSIAIIFILGTQKSFIFSRQYYFQSIAGLLNNPYGVGLGNFKFISEDSANHIFGFNGRSSYAEGIIFEFLSGLGILGLIFIYFFVKVSVQVVSGKTQKPAPEIALFIALTVNFLFDYTYFIPTMLWLWFLLLGLSQRSLVEER